MATTLKKQFLDYTGLSQFWGIIDHKFANKTDAVKVGTFSIANRTKDDFAIAYQDANDAVAGSGAATGYSFTLPAADETNAGLLSAEHFALIDDIDNKINEAAPFHGLKIDGNEVQRDGQKRANIGLNFVTEGDVAAGTRKAYIDLVDRNYPATGTWAKIEEKDYDANLKHHHAYTNNIEGDPGYGTTTYWAWSIEGATGPVNNLGAPLQNKPVSRIDVSELVKAGLLQDADVILKDGEMFLKLVFITNGAGTETKEVLINVTDLVDIYTEGEGIEITNDANSAGDNARAGVVKLRTANWDGKNELGGIRVGYTTDDATQAYKVQLDPTGNAYVVVPWAHTTVTAKSEKKNGEQNLYLDVKCTPTSTTTKDANGNDITTTNYEISVEVSEGLERAEGLAKTSVQDARVGTVSETDDTAIEGAIGITKDAYLKVQTIDNGGWGRTVRTELTNSAKASLGLADTSVQKVTTATVERGDDTHTPTGDDLEVSLINDANAAYGNEKGQKTIKVTLGDKTIASLDKADTAMQNITIMGTTLDIDDPVYETWEAKKALSLGSAANVNTSDAIPGDGHDETHKSVAAPVAADFATDVEKPDGTMEARDYVATAKAVKTYVDAQNEKYYTTLTDYTTARINELDADVTVGKTTDVAYGNAYGEGTQAQQVFIGVGQTDGKLTAGQVVPYTLGIADIADFAPITLTDIESICKWDAATNTPKA